jgi:hypothetical protein
MGPSIRARLRLPPEIENGALVAPFRFLADSGGRPLFC